MKRNRTLAALAAAGVCLLPACGSDDEKSSSSSGGPSQPAALDVKVTEKGKAATFDIPKSLKAGLVEVSLDNAGGRAPHSVQLVRVDGDQTAEEVKKATSGEGGIPEWVHGAGGLGVVEPGQSATTTVVLEPGTYYVQDDASGPSGPIEKMQVTGEAGSAELPSAPAKITAKDFSFETSGLKAGKNKLTFENTGKELHHVIALPMRPGAKIEDVKKAFASEGPPSGPPPVDEENGFGTAVLDGGASQVTELEFKPGKYALACFITNRAGGPPHVALGMVNEVTIP